MSFLTLGGKAGETLFNYVVRLKKNLGQWQAGYLVLFILYRNGMQLSYHRTDSLFNAFPPARFPADQIPPVTQWNAI